MKTLFAINFPMIEHARGALDKLKDLQKGQTITMADAVIVTRNAEGAVKLDQSVNTTAIGAMSGALWGSLIGLLFLSPMLGPAIGAAAGAAGGYTTDYGIADDFMKSLGERQRPNSVTLFVLAADMTPDKVASTIGTNAGEVIYTSMPDDLEQRFKSRFAKSSWSDGDAAAPTAFGNDTGDGPSADAPVVTSPIPAKATDSLSVLGEDPVHPVPPATPQRS